MRRLMVAATIGAVVLAGCSKGNEYGSSDSALRSDSANGSAATTPMTAPDTSNKLSDANIVALLDEANAADSSAGKLASTKGTSADVKAFGKLMARDHHALRKMGADTAKKLGITPQPPANDSLPSKVQAAMDNLNSTAKGAGWDKTYIDGEVATHQMVLSLLDTMEGQAQAPELKNLITKAKPTIQMHLQRAQDIQSKLGADSTAGK